MKHHITKDGVKMLIKDMSMRHLENTIRNIEKRAVKGITISVGGYGDAEDMCYDEWVATGLEALAHMNYNAYKSELNERLKKITGIS